jgi:tetratricopeptide (TPR) repeat protein
MVRASLFGRLTVLLALLLAAACISPAEAQAAPDAQSLLASGKVEQARDAFEQLLLQNPADASAREGVSVSSERMALEQRAAGHMDGALATLLRAKHIEPDDKRILLDLGILEEEMGLYLDAASTLRHLESLPPVDPNVSYALGRVDLSLGRLTEAEQEMQTYLKEHPEDASAHFGLGRIYLEGLQFDKAERELDQSIALQPKQTEGYYELGQAYLDQDRYQDSIAQFQKALLREPQHAGALSGIGIAYFRLKRYDLAREWLLKGTQVAPDYQTAHYYLGLTLSRTGDAEGSHRELEIATELAAKDAKQAASRLRLNSPEGQP